MNLTKHTFLPSARSAGGTPASGVVDPPGAPAAMPARKRVDGRREAGRTGTLVVALGAALLALPAGAAEEFGTVGEELAKVRHHGAELYTRESSVFGQLPGPEESAAHQARCRPVPVPVAGLMRELSFDAATTKRAAGLDPLQLRQEAGRLQMTVLPLGITGAYVVEAQGKVELLVVHVLDDAPATGVLQVDDIVIGANGRLFSDPEDPRPQMGSALCESQSKELGGILTLHIVRGGRPVSVRMGLGSTLDFSATWPYNCEKTKKVREAALRHVMDSHPWHRYDFWNGLFLLASGDDEALELARRHLCAGLKDDYEPGTGGSAWSDGYHLTNLCEYYLLTGDSSVLPGVRNLAENVAWAQYRSGSWSHGAGKGPDVPEPGTAGGGYGEVNNAGLGALIGLCLARQCGIEPFDHTIPRSIRFFGPFCGENIGYGLGTPSDSRTGRMDNGMNGMSALVFHLLGEEAMAERWARSVCYMWMGRERGHAEAIFSAAWGPVSADLAPRPEFHAFMNHQKWMYEMGRDRAGALHFMRGSRWPLPNMTAACGLFLYLPEKRLQVLGGDSVFARTPPAGLQDAAQFYKDKKWEELRKFLGDYLEGTPSDEQTSYAKKLLEASRRLERHAHATLQIIERNIGAGNLKTAGLQLDLLAKLMGRELPGARPLREKIPADAGKLRDAGREQRQPLIDSGRIITELKLAKGGIRDGWAHSPEYITRVNQQGFEGMTARQIAPYVGHFSGGVAGGAIAALAERGEEALPLLKEMLGDSHPGVRSGAIDTLARLYTTGIEDYRTEVPDDLLEVIRLVRPMLEDESKLVRNAVSNFVIELKVLNPDIYEMIEVLARQGGNVHNFVRHAVKDPAVRTRLAMAIVDSNNERRVNSPGSYIPMVCVAYAHPEECRPYMQTAVDTINNPVVQTMYGFFSNHPEDAALQIMSRFHEHPLVLENLPVIIGLSYRRGGPNVYWDVHQEFPHRLAIQLGPRSLPVIETFWQDMNRRVGRIVEGKEEPPPWWKPPLADALDQNIAEWNDTAELIRCLNDMKPVDEAVDGMVAHCLKDRWWGAWERARVWDKLIAMGPEILPQLRESITAARRPAEARCDKRIAALRARIAASEDRGEKRKLENELGEMEAKRAELDERVAELGQLASLIEPLHAGQPGDGHVRGLCTFYLRPPYRKVYPYHGNDAFLGLARPLHAAQDRQIRDKLTAWGPAALPALRDFLAEGRRSQARRLEELDGQEAHWREKGGRGAGAPLRSIGNERLYLAQMQQELQDLAECIDLTSREKLTGDQITALCGICTRHDWPAQRQLIRKCLERQPGRSKPVIARFVETSRAALDEARADLQRLMGKGINDPDLFSYRKDRFENLRRGLDQLQGTPRYQEGSPPAD